MPDLPTGIHDSNCASSNRVFWSVTATLTVVEYILRSDWLTSSVNASSRLGERSAEDGRVGGGGVPLPTGKGSGECPSPEIVLLCDLEMACFGEF